MGVDVFSKTLRHFQMASTMAIFSIFLIFFVVVGKPLFFRPPPPRGSSTPLPLPSKNRDPLADDRMAAYVGFVEKVGEFYELNLGDVDVYISKQISGLYISLEVYALCTGSVYTNMIDICLP